MASVDELLQRADFINWVKSGMVLKISQEALEEFVETTNEKIHTAFLKHITALSSCSDCTSVRVCRNCLSIVEVELKKMHVTRKPSFSNSTLQDCLSSAWEFAKHFMSPKGYRHVTAPSETDIHGLISVVVNNWEFYKYLPPGFPRSRNNVFYQAREARNHIMHNPSFEVSEQTFQDYLNIFIQMISSIPLTETAKSSLTRMHEIDNGTIQISLGDIVCTLDEAVESLKIFRVDINASIQKMSDVTNIFKQTLQDETSKGVSFVKLTIEEAVTKLHEQTQKGVCQLREHAEYGIVNIQKEKTKATSKVSNVKGEAIDSIQMESLECISRINRQGHEHMDRLSESFETETMTFKEVSRQTSEEINKLQALVTKEYDMLVRMISVEREKENNREEDTGANAMPISGNSCRHTDNCLKLLQNVTKACADMLQKTGESSIRGHLAIADTRRSDVVEHVSRSEYEELREEVKQLRMEMEDSLCPTQRKKFPFDYLDVQHHTEKNSSITGMAKINDDNLAVADHKNGKIKVINVRENRITSLIKVDDPWDITCVDSNTLVASCGKYLQFLDIQNEKILKRALAFDDTCRGVEYFENKLVVSFISKEEGYVKLVCMDEQVLNSFDIQFSIPNYVCVNANKTSIYVADYGLHQVINIDLKGRILQKYSDSYLGPFGIAVDTHNHVYVAGKTSGNIHKLPSHRDCMRMFIDKSKGMERPQAITYCANENKLYISQTMNGEHIVSVRRLQFHSPDTDEREQTDDENYSRLLYTA